MGGLISRFPCSLKNQKGPALSTKQKKKEDSNNRVDGLIKH
jgi:hypothetical protein